MGKDGAASEQPEAVEGRGVAVPRALEDKVVLPVALRTVGLHMGTGLGGDAPKAIERPVEPERGLG